MVTHSLGLEIYPIIERKSVLLPHPLGPIKVVIFPVGIETVISCKIWRFPSVTDSCFTAIAELFVLISYPSLIDTRRMAPRRRP